MLFQSLPDRHLQPMRIFCMIFMMLKCMGRRMRADTTAKIVPKAYLIGSVYLKRDNDKKCIPQLRRSSLTPTTTS